jgi:hypothetical protein
MRPTFDGFVHCCVRIEWSARKHGIVDADIEHAMEHAVTIEYQDDGRWLYLGSSRSGRRLRSSKSSATTARSA